MVFRTMRYQIDFISEIEISANLRRPFDINLKAEYVSLGKNKEVMTASPLSENTSAQPTSTNNLNVTVPPISILLAVILLAKPSLKSFIPDCRYLLKTFLFF